jgi:Ca2+-binding EF-hand superfamily protein
MPESCDFDSNEHIGVCVSSERLCGLTSPERVTAATTEEVGCTVGEAELKQMLPLMDQDKDGKVSKQGFMKFMEAEFDRSDKKKEGKLDVKKLTQPPAQPVRGFRK